MHFAYNLAEKRAHLISYLRYWKEMGVNDGIKQNTLLSFSEGHNSRERYFAEELAREGHSTEQDIQNLEQQYIQGVSLLKDYVIYRARVLETYGAKSPAVELCITELDKLMNLQTATVLNMASA
jgi:hypothetical protein